MKVALLGNDTTYTYNLRREIIKGLIEEGYEVDVFGELLLLQEELKALGCNLVEISTGRHGTNPLKDLKLLNSYICKLKQSKPDVVISYNIKPNVYGGMACKRLHIPYLPNITGLGTPVENPGPMQKLAIILYKIGVSGADCVFFQNEENHQFFVKHGMLGKKSRVNVLPGSGVSLETHPLLPYPEEGVTNFLFVARVLKEKGIDLFLAAARKYHSDTVKFHICGMCDDESYKQILAEEQEKGVVIYHGEQKDMRPFFEMCSCVFHPSYYPEGMSNVLLEGAASGRSLICADRAGCREVVDNGVTGFVVPVKDEEAVIKAVRKFLEMPWSERKKMGLAGRAKVEREFDRQIVVSEYLKEIKRSIR
jgi:galacturonosyltransferase